MRYRDPSLAERQGQTYIEGGSQPGGPRRRGRRQLLLFRTRLRLMVLACATAHLYPKA